MFKNTINQKLISRPFTQNFNSTSSKNFYELKSIFVPHVYWNFTQSAKLGPNQIEYLGKKGFEGRYLVLQLQLSYRPTNLLNKLNHYLQLIRQAEINQIQIYPYFMKVQNKNMFQDSKIDVFAYTLNAFLYEQDQYVQLLSKETL